jgi:hypothetical protein
MYQNFDMLESWHGNCGLHPQKVRLSTSRVDKSAIANYHYHLLISQAITLKLKLKIEGLSLIDRRKIKISQSMYFQVKGKFT